MVAAVTVPTPAFAVALSATGAVHARAHVSAREDAETHFALLEALPPNSMVWYRESPTKRREAILLGTEVKGGLRRAVISTVLPGGTGKAKCWVQCAKIEPMDKPSEGLPEHARLRHARVGMLVAGLYSESLQSVLSGNRLDCLIVGNKGRLEDEIRSAEFAIVPEGGRPVSGRLQDLLLARRFARSGDRYRSDLIAASAGNEFAVRWTPPVVVFDGANSYLKLGHQWPGADRIVVLDRAEARFNEAVQDLNLRYVADRAEGGRFDDLPQVPAGVEFMLFGLAGP